jgi:hypothetical protein
MIDDIESDAWEAYKEWHHVLANPSLSRDGTTFSWRERTSIIVPELMLPSDFIDLVQQRQYSFQNAIDGGIFQIYYEFHPRSKILVSARLAYYFPNQIPMIELIDNEIDLELYDDISEEQAEPESVGWLRLDYDPSGGSGLVHPPCHLHLGGFPSARIPVKGVPKASQFIEFIMCTLYANHFAEYRLDERGEYHAKDKLGRLANPLIPMDDEYCASTITHLRTAGA